MRRHTQRQEFHHFVVENLWLDGIILVEEIKIHVLTFDVCHDSSNQNRSAKEGGNGKYMFRGGSLRCVPSKREMERRGKKICIVTMTVSFIRSIL